MKKEIYKLECQTFKTTQSKQGSKYLTTHILNNKKIKCLINYKLTHQELQEHNNQFKNKINKIINLINDEQEVPQAKYINKWIKNSLIKCKGKE